MIFLKKSNFFQRKFRKKKLYGHNMYVIIINYLLYLLITFKMNIKYFEISSKNMIIQISCFLRFVHLSRDEYLHLNFKIKSNFE